MEAFLLISTVTAAAQLVMYNGSLPVDKLSYSSCPLVMYNGSLPVDKLSYSSFPTCDVQWKPSC